ncbi:MAG: cytochrome c [Nitrospinaceae bacterium]|nr:cytochrome c [Nitrospinaceae bacterium]NIT81973.1 cytochrome c [Nitrospinaceae bacterium]NIU96357.1 c-type cytochrome [Nitrospinaceae bacterium]
MKRPRGYFSGWGRHGSRKAMGWAVFLAGTLAWSGLAAGQEDRPECPQPRFTERAPDDYYSRINPLEPTAENLKKGRLLYMVRAKPMPCKHCHGIDGDGRGPMARGFHPPPRNFTCAETIRGVPDGQLFWIIQNGSPGTGMIAFKSLKEEQIWQIILYLRQLAQL